MVRNRDKIVEQVVNTNLFNNLPEKCGGFDGKYKNTCSLSTHLINSWIVGLKYYIHDCDKANKEKKEDDYRILSAALVLHDCNKFVSSYYDKDFDNNSRECLKLYFEEDPLGVEDFLVGEGENIEDYFEDLLYLIQGAEVSEDSSDSRGYSGNYKWLRDYVRRGDTISSYLASEDFPSESQFDEEYLTFNSLEQPILNNLCINSISSVIRSRGGFVLGYGEDYVVYLNKGKTVEIDNKFREEVKQKLFQDYILKDSSPFEFSIDVEWNYVKFNSLPELGGIPYDKKLDMISEQFAQEFKSGLAHEGYEKDIEDKFKSYIPYLIYGLYIKDTIDFKDVTKLKKLWNKIGSKESDSRKDKLAFLRDLYEETNKFEGALDTYQDKIDGELRKYLSSNFDYGSVIMERLFDEGEDLSVQGEVCFLCGRNDNLNKYSPGRNAIFASNSDYSRKTECGKKNKKICSVCLLEYNFSESLCNNSSVRISDSSFVYFYVDDFVADISLTDEQFFDMGLGSDISSLLDKDDYNSKQMWLPYNISPVSFNDKIGRLCVVEQCLKLANKFGLKVVIANPFRKAISKDKVFYDSSPISRQTSLGINSVSFYEEKTLGELNKNNSMSLDRAIDIIELLKEISKEGDYYNFIGKDDFIVILDEYIKNNNYIPNEKINKYVKSYHYNRFMKMKDVAKSGLELYGEQYSSKYSKTKVFRIGIESILEGLSKGVEGDALKERVSGEVMKSAESVAYTQIKNEQVDNFVEELFNYLEENGDIDMMYLSDNQNSLVNTYYYCYEELLNEKQNS
jgi:CRISPR-associated protein Csc3